MHQPARPLSNDPIGEDSSFDEFRRALTRRLKNLREAWRGCPSRTCRRARACIDPELPCALATAAPRDPEEAARILSGIRKMLERLPRADEEDRDQNPHPQAPGKAGPRRMRRPGATGSSSTRRY